ncbi:MAG: hypothetical protein WAV48_05005 [Candidatus Magasanikiibacteriota bacterium]
MFSVEWQGVANGHNCGEIGEIFFTRANGPKLHLCFLNTWALASCAAFSVQEFANCGLSKEDTNAFFDFLNSEECDRSWSPKEIYFLLSDSQGSLFQGRNLSTHPNVKKVDTFTNKAHSGNYVSLFRYSLAKDFIHKGTT